MVSSMPISNGESAKDRKELTCQSLKCEMLSKKYDNGTTALRGVSVTIEPGEFAYIVDLLGQVSQPLFELYTRSKRSKRSLSVAGFNLVKIKKKRYPASTS